MNLNYNIIKKNDNLCFICLDKIDYYIKFNCECHNYLHKSCVENIFITKCFICHKKTYFANSISNNYSSNYNYIDSEFVLEITEKIIEKIYIKYILNYTFTFFQNNPNLLSFGLYFTMSMIVAFLIIIPLIILSLLLNLLKYLKSILTNNIYKYIILFLIILIFNNRHFFIPIKVNEI
jgi:hypothetical protein